MGSCDVDLHCKCSQFALQTRLGLVKLFRPFWIYDFVALTLYCKMMSLFYIYIYFISMFTDGMVSNLCSDHTENLPTKM